MKPFFWFLLQGISDSTYIGISHSGTIYIPEKKRFLNSVLKYLKETLDSLIERKKILQKHVKHAQM